MHITVHGHSRPVLAVHPNDPVRRQIAERDTLCSNRRDEVSARDVEATGREPFPSKSPDAGRDHQIRTEQGPENRCGPSVDSHDDEPDGREQPENAGGQMGVRADV